MPYPRTTNSVSRYFFAAAVPVSLFAVQLFGDAVAAGLLLMFILAAHLYNRARATAILACFLIVGCRFSVFAGERMQSFCANNLASRELGVVLSRLGLAGYLVLFLVWYLRSKTSEHYFAVGNLHADIRMPFVWYGFHDNAGRVAVGFSLACTASAGVLAVMNRLSPRLLWLGLVFSLLNAVLEELLWRGFVLNRLNDAYGEKLGLLVMSLTFGVYHYAMGFSLPACLFFALGGICFGGVAIRSKGLLLATVMHFCMNLLFVAMGIIF